MSKSTDNAGGGMVCPCCMIILAWSIVWSLSVLWSPTPPNCTGANATLSVTVLTTPRFPITFFLRALSISLYCFPSKVVAARGEYLLDLPIVEMDAVLASWLDMPSVAAPHSLNYLLGYLFAFPLDVCSLPSYT